MEKDVHDFNEVHKVGLAPLPTLHQCCEIVEGERLQLIKVDDRYVFLEKRRQDRECLVGHFTFLQQSSQLNHHPRLILHLFCNDLHILFGIYVIHIDI